jgi:DNA-binding MarR family transcriptional regulator
MQRRSGLGTRIRHLLDLLDGDLTRVYREAGLDYRPRYTPVIRALHELGPSSIATLAAHAGLTHSAVSQTVAEMKRRRLLRVTRGSDARSRKVSLSPSAEHLLPQLGSLWAATAAAAATLDGELKTSLVAAVEEAITALEHRPFRTRIHDAAGAVAVRADVQGGPIDGATREGGHVHVLRDDNARRPNTR